MLPLRPGKEPGHLVAVRHEARQDVELGYRVVRDQEQVKVISHEPGVFELEFDDGQTQRVEVASVPAPVDLSQGWELTFEGLGKSVAMKELASWTGLPDEDMRNYSGTVTYRKSFTWSSGAKLVELDLGSLKNIAEVSVNGKSVGLLWKPPYRLDITSALNPGKNELAIKVTNLLVNRITADYALPAEKRHLAAFGAIEQYRPGVESGKDGLLPSGLFGPVLLRAPVVAAVPAATIPRTGVPSCATRRGCATTSSTCISTPAARGTPKPPTAEVMQR
jgi:hypothetical protein